MTEESEPLTIERVPPQISHRGILTAMGVLIAFLAIAGFVFGGALFGFGILFGGGLSYVNYLWLERSTRAIFDQTAVATTGILAAKYILRYAAIGAALLAIHLTGALPVAAVIVGLSAFALAVVLQGFKNIFS